MRRTCALAVIALACSLDVARAAKRIDFEKEVLLLKRGQQHELAIPDAKNRVAVFPYEDPDRTGLGNALGALVAREILFGTDVTSLGVLRYEGGLSPETAESPSYFDKVALVTEAQCVTLSLWGAVRRSGEALAVDTYLQFPPGLVKESLRRSVRLPGAMGGGELVAHVRPDRILVQHLEIPREAEGAFRTAALAGDQLRTASRADLEPFAELPVDSVYRVMTVEGDWAYVEAGPNRAGWVQVRGSCTGRCAVLLESARFASGLLRYLNSRAIPHVGPSLADDAKDVADQLRVFQALDSGRVEDLESAWREVRGETRGAAFANLHAMVKIAIDLRRGEREQGERVALDKAGALEIAFDLAEASQSDPRNADVLHNLGVLFECGGDRKRADLARTLARGFEATGAGAGKPCPPDGAGGQDRAGTAR